MIHPGAGSVDKCVAIERLEEAAVRLAVGGVRTVWMIGPAERERFGAPLVSRLERVGAVFEDEDVCVAAERVCAAGAFVGHDTGMTHVAAGAGVRTVALFGPTDPRIWQPKGPRVRVERFRREAAEPDRLADRIVRFVTGGRIS